MNNDKLLKTLSDYLTRIGKANQVPHLPVRLKLCKSNTEALIMVRVLASNS